jgi:hypothetical protein
MGQAEKRYEEKRQNPSTRRQTTHVSGAIAPTAMSISSNFESFFVFFFFAGVAFRPLFPLPLLALIGTTLVGFALLVSLGLSLRTSLRSLFSLLVLVLLLNLQLLET